MYAEIDDPNLTESRVGSFRKIKVENFPRNWNLYSPVEDDDEGVVVALSVLIFEKFWEPKVFGATFIYAPKKCVKSWFQIPKMVQFLEPKFFIFLHFFQKIF